MALAEERTRTTTRIRGTEIQPAHAGGGLRNLHAEYARSGDPALMQELVLAHAGLARSVAQRFGARGRETMDDVLQVAYLALIQAVERFDPDLGYQFSTYATQVIVGTLKRHRRDFGWALRPSRRVHDCFLETQRALDELTQEHGRPPTVDEVAERIGVPVEDVLEAQEAASALTASSIDDASSRGGRAAPKDYLAGDDPGYDAVEQRDLVSASLSRLRPEDRRLLRLRFLAGMSQRQIAQVLGQSQMRVSRGLRRALEHAREGLEL